jgi:hypothetical protein
MLFVREEMPGRTNEARRGGAGHGARGRGSFSLSIVGTRHTRGVL